MYITHQLIGGQIIKTKTMQIEKCILKEISDYKPKEIAIPYISVSYPVGSNMANLKRITDEYVNAFKTLQYPEGSKFNLFCSGSSGAIISTAFALALPEYMFKICHVKKPGEGSHQDEIEYEPSAINIVIDDFISMGTTIRRILHEMSILQVKPKILIVCTGDLKEESIFETIIRYKP